jgi:hypothetical protein
MHAGAVSFTHLGKSSINEGKFAVQNFIFFSDRRWYKKTVEVVIIFFEVIIVTAFISIQKQLQNSNILQIIRIRA